MQGFYRFLAFFLIPVLLLLVTAGCEGNGFGGASAPVSALLPCTYADPVFYQIPANINNMISMMTYYQSDPNALSKLQLDSYSLLVYEMMKWSVQHDVVAGSVTYRFTVTLISPELITSTIMAEYVNHNKIYSSDALAELTQWIEKRKNEQRVLFLLTINTSDQGSLPEPGKQAIRVPIGDMTLTTMSGLQTSKPQAEGIFAYDLDSYDNPIRYFFYFPTAVLVGDVCTQLLDPGKDLTITLGISTVRINGELIGDLSWNFELAHLLNIAREGDPRSFSSYPQVTSNQFLNEPFLPICAMPVAAPKTNTTTSTQLAGDINYWLSFSFCAWETISGIP